MNKFALVGGVLLCLSGVAIGAFGAHALAELLEHNGRETVFELANRYQFYHGLSLLLVAVISNQKGIQSTTVAVVMLTGTLVFSGSLYLLAVTNIGILGAVTPIGGTLLIVAWVWFLYAIMRT